MIDGFHFSRPRHFVLLLGASLSLNVLALALPLMTMQIYDRVLSNHAEDTLMVLSLGVLGAACAELALRICRSIAVGLNGAWFEHEAATLALARLLEAEPRASAGSTPATLAQDIGAAARLKDYYGGQMMVTLLVDTPFMLVFIALVAYLVGWLALIQCTVLAAYAFLSWKEGLRLRSLIDARDAQDNARYSFITQSLQIIHTVKALCLEAVTARRFEEVQKGSAAVNYRIACLQGQSGSISYAFAQIMTVAVVCAGAPMAISGHITTGTLIACVLLSGQVMQTLQRGLSLWVRFQDIAHAKERFSGLLSLPSRHVLALEETTASHGALKLDRVRFAYPGQNAVVDGATVEIPPGDTFALTGGSGVGKTTLLELMAGVYAPDEGRIQLNGQDVSRLSVTERARYIAYLPMGGMILRGSIMDNLTGFDPRHRKEARIVADQLGIEEAVSLLPSGYDTPLEGLNTDVIAPGLKQRISIARALLFKPRLILFDNADHGMDRESYSRIFDLLARLKGRATMVIVSDDRNIISLADHVMEIRHGQLTPLMAPSQLMTDKRRALGATL
jgi:ATP-binding cassette subfamily C protein LapB